MTSEAHFHGGSAVGWRTRVIFHNPVTREGRSVHRVKNGNPRGFDLSNYCNFSFLPKKVLFATVFPRIICFRHFLIRQKRPRFPRITPMNLEKVKTLTRLPKGAERIGTPTKHVRQGILKRTKTKRGFLDEKKSRRLFQSETKNPNLRKTKPRSKTTGDVFPVCELPGVGDVQFRVEP